MLGLEAYVLGLGLVSLVLVKNANVKQNKFERRSKEATIKLAGFLALSVTLTFDPSGPKVTAAA